MGTTQRRTQVQALDAIAEQLRIANHIALLGLTPAVLDDADLAKAREPQTKRRQARLNRIRAEVRAGLGLEEKS